MTPPDVSLELAEGRKTLETVARPNIFTTLVALFALAGLGVLVYFDRQDRAREATVQVEVMRGMVQELKTMNQRLTAIELRLRMRPPPAAPHADEPEYER